MGRCDKWTVLRIFEVILVVACLVYKRVTDDEARGVFLYLQKLSREWSLLQNVTWDRVGSSVADATFGGYTIITVALLLGKLFGELPTRKRVMEWTFLFVGAVLFIAIGSLAYASIDSVPQHLVDNAAILGTLSIVTGALFLMDMGSPKKRDPRPPTPPVQIKHKKKPFEQPDVTDVNDVEMVEDTKPQKRSITEQVYDIEREVERSERATHQPLPNNGFQEEKVKDNKDLRNNGIKQQQRTVTTPNMDRAVKNGGQQQVVTPKMDRTVKSYGQQQIITPKMDRGGPQQIVTPKMARAVKNGGQQPKTERPSTPKIERPYKHEEPQQPSYRNGAFAQRIEKALKEPPPPMAQRSYIGYKPMQDDEFDVPKRFGIYGKDVTDYGNDTDETASIPPKIELHTPVWSNIRKGRESTRNYGMINFR